MRNHHGRDSLVAPKGWWQERFRSNLHAQWRARLPPEFGQLVDPNVNSQGKVTLRSDLLSEPH